MSSLPEARDGYTYSSNTLYDTEAMNSDSVSLSSAEPNPKSYHYTQQMYHPTPLPYQNQAEFDWQNCPSPISSTSPTTPSPHLSNATLKDCFPSSWPTGPTSNCNQEATKPIQDIQHLTDAKSRRRQQNRDSQRAFRERKNRHIEQLEHALADLQYRHEKLLQCFVGLTARISGEGLGGNMHGNGMEDLRFLNRGMAGTGIPSVGGMQFMGV